MKLGIDSSGFTQERIFAVNVPPKLKKRIWTQIRVVSFSAERMIKIRMPVDTGRARASWGHNSGAMAAVDESIWQEDEDALSLTQGSRVGYIEQLNEGSSKQAPAGFIDVEERKALDMLSDALGVEVEALFSST